MKGNPILHMMLFGILLAAILFLAHGPPGEEDEARRVEFTRADVAQVMAQYSRTWGRAPDAGELREAFERYVREEILYREALARGLDRNDPVVRMNLVRKINVLGSAAADFREPSEEDIEAFFSLRRDRYRQPGTVGFRQVVLSPALHGESLGEDVEKLLAYLREREPPPEDLPEFGDLRMLPGVVEEISEEDLLKDYGPEFRDALAALTPGRWEGPIETGYGMHLVKLTRREDSRIPELSRVRDRVLTDMRYEARRAAGNQLYAELAALYRIDYDEIAATALEGRVP